MIGIVSPHLFSIDGTPSPNIGDQIIYTYLVREVKKLFPTEVFYDFPLHAGLNKYHRFLLKKCDLIFVTGSNFLTPRISSQRKALISLGELGITDKVIFMGAGWSGHVNHNLDKESIELYRKVLHKKYPHSVRDSISLNKLSVINLPVVNTSCPTMWALKSMRYRRTKVTSDCLFTLTDYSINIDEDESLLNLLLSNFKNLYFFPQGKYDIEYLSSLEVYKNHRERFSFLERSLKSLDDFIDKSDFTYVGTRLHCGIHLLNSDKDVLILEVDNRAKGIAADTNLPVCKRGDLDLVAKWLDGGEVFNEFSLPKSWNKWKESFKG